MTQKLKLSITAVLLTGLLLTGCGNDVRTEKELQSDLKSHSEFQMAEGGEISDFTIIKRKTDEHNKSDIVYVSVVVDHEMAPETRSYIMTYSEYNEGWMLDRLDVYMQDENDWTVTPKGGPANDTIMEQLIGNSNSHLFTEADLQEGAEKAGLSDGWENICFFEDGKYTSEIYDGNLEDFTYKCIVETNRKFNFVEVQEIDELTFEFNKYSYGWDLIHYEILDSRAEWNLQENWEVHSGFVTLDWSRTNYAEQWASYDIAFDDGEVNLHGFVKLDFPTSKDTGWVQILLEGTKSLIFCPDKICFSDYERLTYMEPMSSSVNTEKESIIDIQISEENERYAETAEKIARLIYEERDREAVYELVHPFFRDVIMEYLEDFMYTYANQFDDVEIYIKELEIDTDDEFSEYMLSEGYHVDKVIACNLMIVTETEAGKDMEKFEVFLIEDGEELTFFVV